MLNWNQLDVVQWNQIIKLFRPYFYSQWGEFYNWPLSTYFGLLNQMESLLPWCDFIAPIWRRESIGYQIIWSRLNFDLTIYIWLTMTKQDDQTPNGLTISRSHGHGSLEKMCLGSFGAPLFPCHLFLFNFQTFIVFPLPPLFLTILIKVTYFVCRSLRKFFHSVQSSWI